jgi:hypothetical protein
MERSARFESVDDVRGRQVQEALPHWYRFTVIAQDPSVLKVKPDDPKKKILTARVRIPADWLEPGPRSHRFHVVDYDETRRHFAKPYSLLSQAWKARDRFEDAADAELLEGESGEQFRAQNVFAIASRTLEMFETALGRRVNWSFGDHQLYLVPSAGAMNNAYYSPSDRAIIFGYFKRDDALVRTCLFHDVIAHETTHAILDALRPRLIEPGLADQRAFHEGFADIVALLSVFSIPEVVQKALRQHPTFDRESMKNSILFTLAEQWSPNDRGLRSSIKLRADSSWKEKRLEPHTRGEVIVSAVMQTLLEIWLARVERLRGDQQLVMTPAAREGTILLAAEEGAKSAQHLLSMVIRALDYTPPAEIEFADFLDAILVSDREMAPDDELKYRDKLTASFKKFGIVQAEERIIDLDDARYENLHFNLLRADRDEVYRFLWQNSAAPRRRGRSEGREITADGREVGRGLGLSRDFYTRVESILPSTRVGPDGFIVSETVASYVQYVEGTLRELMALSKQETERSTGVLEVPDGLDLDTKVRMYGAGAIIFDQYGRAKFHQIKPLENWTRQSLRLRQMQALGYFDRAGGLDDAALRASLHAPRYERGEW